METVNLTTLDQSPRFVYSFSENVKYSANLENTKYFTEDYDEQIDGKPDTLYTDIVVNPVLKTIYSFGTLIGKPKSKNLVLGEGLVKTITEDTISISIDQDYLKSFITQYINNFVDNNWIDDTEISKQYYDILELCINYTIDDSKYNWYNFDYTTSNIIKFDEPDATVPSGVPNFVDKYVPSFTMTLKKPLNLETTPYINLQYFTLNSCPINFRFIDANGKCSTPIICGHRENDGSSSTTIVIDTDSNQNNTTLKITSVNNCGYTEQKTISGIDNYITGTLVPEYTTNGAYADSKVAKSSIVNILTELEHSFTAHEDTGFDRTNIVCLRVQLVETWDKSQITYKERHKAVIFNKFEFTAEKI